MSTVDRPSLPYATTEQSGGLSVQVMPPDREGEVMVVAQSEHGGTGIPVAVEERDVLAAAVARPGTLVLCEPPAGWLEVTYEPVMRAWRDARGRGIADSVDDELLGAIVHARAVVRRERQAEEAAERAAQDARRAALPQVTDAMVDAAREEMAEHGWRLETGDVPAMRATIAAVLAVALAGQDAPEPAVPAWAPQPGERVRPVAGSWEPAASGGRTVALFPVGGGRWKVRHQYAEGGMAQAEALVGPHDWALEDLVTAQDVEPAVGVGLRGREVGPWSREPGGTRWWRSRVGMSPERVTWPVLLREHGPLTVVSVVAGG